MAEEEVVYETSAKGFETLANLVSGLILGWHARDHADSHDIHACDQCSASVSAVLVGMPFDEARKLMCPASQQARERIVYAQQLVDEWTPQR